MRLNFLELVIISCFLSFVLLGVRWTVFVQTPRDWTDAKTGCEFLISGSGSITPRIDADGIHMGCKGLQDQP